ncbi:polypeptide N-acetylgalactosaminyltransferase 10 [Tachysurus ichikawai]
MKGNQLWRYRKDYTLLHPVSNSCVDSDSSDKRIFMNSCDPKSLSQQWRFENVNMTVLEQFNRNLPAL